MPEMEGAADGIPEPTLHDLHAKDAPMRVAVAFCLMVRREFDRATVREIVRRNHEHVAEGDPDTCATHDFCDANMLMADAFSMCGLLDPIEHKSRVLSRLEAEAEKAGRPFNEDAESERFHESELSGAGYDLWNLAWPLAKDADFDPARVGLAPDALGPFTCPRCEQRTPAQEGGSDCPLCSSCWGAMPAYWRGWWSGAEGWSDDEPEQDGEAWLLGHAAGEESRDTFEREG